MAKIPADASDTKSVSCNGGTSALLVSTEICTQRIVPEADCIPNLASGRCDAAEMPPVEKPPPAGNYIEIPAPGLQLALRRE